MQTKTKFMAVMAAAVLASMTGCATVMKGSHDTVTVNSLEKGTTIYIDGAPRGLDIAQAQVKRGKTSEIRAAKEGCKDVSVSTTESFDAVVLLGILIDYGIITIPTDLISGNAWKVSPTAYTVTPICEKTS